jgi:hypothetical protein
MPIVVRLLGPPRAECDDGPPPVPRGRKPWALLALVRHGVGAEAAEAAAEARARPAVQDNAALVALAESCRS